MAAKQEDTNSSVLILEPGEDNTAQFQELTSCLLDWVNEVVRQRSIVVRSFFEDLWDGSVLVELVEILRGVDLCVSNNVLLSAANPACKTKWESVLAEIAEDTDILHLGQSCGQWGYEEDWRQSSAYETVVKASVLEEIMAHNPLVLVQIVIQLVEFHRVSAYPKLPRNVQVRFVRAMRYGDGMVTVPITVQLTSDADGFWAGQGEVQQLQQTVNSVRQMYQGGQRHVLIYSLLKFVNGHLAHITTPAKGMSDFSNGVMLILLASVLGSFFVRLDSFHATPFGRAEQLHNCDLALSLYESSQAQPLSHIRDICSAEDIVDNNERAVLQLLHAVKVLYV